MSPLVERSTADEFSEASAPIILTEADVAKFLRISRECLRTWRRRGTGPAFSRAGTRLIRYNLADVNAWLLANRSAHCVPDHNAEGR